VNCFCTFVTFTASYCTGLLPLQLELLLVHFVHISDVVHRQFLIIRCYYRYFIVLYIHQDNMPYIYTSVRDYQARDQDNYSHSHSKRSVDNLIDSLPGVLQQFRAPDHQSVHRDHSSARRDDSRPSRRDNLRPARKDNWMVDYENQVSRRFVELRKTQLKFPIFKCIILRNYCMDCFENLTTSSFQGILWPYIVRIINLSAILI